MIEILKLTAFIFTYLIIGCILYVPVFLFFKKELVEKKDERGMIILVVACFWPLFLIATPPALLVLGFFKLYEKIFKLK